MKRFALSTQQLRRQESVTKRATGSEASLRILAVCGQRHGGNDDSFVRAFRRAGHSVLVVAPETFFPSWESKSLRAVRRLLHPVLVAEYNRAIIHAARYFQPELAFIFKGESVSTEALEALKGGDSVTINFYPDTGFGGFRSLLSQTIDRYDWFFTTKPEHVSFLMDEYEYANVTFVPHAFDPEIHVPVSLTLKDRQRYRCDVSFIGNTSAKKQKLLRGVLTALPEVDFRIWGARGWNDAGSQLRRLYQGTPVWGAEYAKAILASKVNLAVLFEGTPSAPAPDVITARTFEIPATGGFMLHERTKEAMCYFEDGRESVFFSDEGDLVEKIRYYLAHDVERRAIAAAGRERALVSGYSYDDRVAAILDKYFEIRGE